MHLLMAQSVFLNLAQTRLIKILKVNKLQLVVSGHVNLNKGSNSNHLSSKVVVLNKMVKVVTLKHNVLLPVDIKSNIILLFV